MVRDLWSTSIIDKPPRISENSRTTNVDSNHHISEEQPFTDKGLTAVPRRHSHDGVVWRVEAESGGR
jgi:hypothetical protein